MKVYELYYDIDRYEHAAEADRVDEPLPLERWELPYGQPFGEDWKPIKIKLIRRNDRGKRVRPGDTPGYSPGIPLLSQRAVDELGDLLADNGEILPLECDDGTYYLFNVTRVIDALDRERSELRYFSSTGRLDEVTRYAFRAEQLEGATIFKIPDFEHSQVYVTDTFVSAVERAGLVGFEFQLLWSTEGDDAAAAAPYRPGTEAAAEDAKETESDRFAREKQAGLERVLGTMHNVMDHAIVPFDAGGALDVYFFPNAMPGTVLASMELILPDGTGTVPNQLGTYEVAACTRKPIALAEADQDATPFQQTERRLRDLMTWVGRSAAAAKLEPGEYYQVPCDEGEMFVVFDRFPIGGGELLISGRKHGLMLCIEVTQDECRYADEHGGERLLRLLKQNGVYPFSDQDRPSTV